MGNIDRFCVVYARELKAAIEAHPDEYAYGVDRVPSVVEKMRAAFVAGTFNHDGRAIKSTCKALGIKHTRTAMLAFFAAAPVVS